MHVKVCGMTRVDDAHVAADAGTDAVGCLVGLDGSPRDEISPDVAGAIFASLPPFVTRVLVTHRTTVSDVVELARASGAQVVGGSRSNISFMLARARLATPGADEFLTCEGEAHGEARCDRAEGLGP